MKTLEFETISDRLKKIRIEKNISQDFLAKKIGITQKAYSKIENNETKLNVEVLQKISTVLDVPIETFFKGSNSPILNDFSSRSGGDNVVYKNGSYEKIELLYEKILISKDQIIKAKSEEIETLKFVIEKLKK
jgi:transcriptional regulator with XRE-family HTH domain